MVNTRFGAVAVALVLAAPVTAHSSSPAPNDDVRARPVLVLNASVDRANERVVLRGQNFGNTAPMVYCETHPLTVLQFTDTEVIVWFPGAVPQGTYLFSVIRGRGHSELDRNVFYVTAPPVASGEGVPGPQGPAGPQGPQGPVGSQGPVGATGAVGPVGPAGPEGVAGPIGPAGAVGAVGPAGPVGPAGSQGEVGSAGPVGPVGPQGPQGLQGETGEAGSVGPVGPAGPAGPVGAQGPQGVQGTQGPVGAQGLQGPAGTNGVSGYQPVTGESPISLNPGTASWFVALCPTGKRPVGGGYELIGGTGAQLNTIASHPYDNSPTVGWRVLLRNNTGAVVTTTVRVHVLCGFVQ
jgi:hypothetical protein